MLRIDSYTHRVQEAAMHDSVFELILQSHSLTLSEWVSLSRNSCMKEFLCCVSAVEELGIKLIAVLTSPGLTR